MNPFLDALLPYPFERMNALKAGLRVRSNAPHIALSIGEPKHATAPFLIAAATDAAIVRSGLATYPATRGSERLRAAISAWTTVRFGLRAGTLTAEHHVLPVNGTREALFSFAQSVLSGRAGACAVLPNPFYQIYEGAILLRGTTPYYVDCPAATGYLPDFDAVPPEVWDACELLFICSPGNPTGAVMPLAQLTRLIELAHRHDFVIASDECYSEIYPDEDHPPVGLLQACAAIGRDDYARCVVFHSLSKRSNLPGLRSGFVAGDAAILERYFLYRTYHGCAMPAHVQHVSELAWSDEAHVVDNRARYREKFATVTPLLERALGVTQPQAGFYYWPTTPIDDELFTQRLFVEENVTVLPGRYLSRPQRGVDPGANRIRMAMVAELDECIDAAERIVRFARSL
jgi:N-succinyldiaminopimelate aminotransferase